MVGVNDIEGLYQQVRESGRFTLISWLDMMGSCQLISKELWEG